MSLILFGPPVHFDFGARKLLPQVLVSAQCAKPLFVTDRGVLSAGVFTQATESLPSGLTQSLFSEVPPNPTETSAIAGAQAFHDFGCDGVIQS